MKRKISLFLMLFFTVLTFAQKTVSGKITDDDGEPIPSASVTVEEPGKDAILAYGITNSKGEYKVTFTSAEPNVDLKVKAFNQKNLIKQITNSDQTLSFKMQSEATEIKEVQLKTRMITAKGDTISYDLKAFENKNDRSLADVMKKIPGIEVNTDGTILYQGTAINKFYVNGKDLMEGGYGTINNSLPKDAVQKIEVLENHQPVKILQNKIPSDQAAINIKLKNAVTMTGRGEVGTGFGDPWLWNVKLTPMFFGQKSQWVVNYKTNNMGEQVENEGNILAFGSGWEGRRINASQNDWLNVENASTPNLPVKRYLMNNVHYLSANYLTNIDKKKEWELKANANYTNNAVERESYTESNDYQQGTHYQSNIRNNFYTDKAKGELIFTKNAKKGFFKNTTSFSQFWNSDRGLTDITDPFGTRQGDESVNSPTTSFQNSLSTILPWKEKMINIKSYINYQDDHQSLDITPASYVKIPVSYDSVTKQFKFFDFLDANTIRQNFNMKTFQANHSANISFTQKGWTFTPEVGLNFSTNKMNSELLGLGNNGTIGYGNSYSNNIKYTNTTPYAAVGVNLKTESWMLFAQLPVNFNNISAKDDERNVSKSLNKVTFEPSAFAQYSFASFWKASLRGSISNNFGDISDMYAGNILSNPGSLSSMSPLNPINEINSKSAGTGIEYRNPLNNIFFNVRYNYSYAKRNLTANSLNVGTSASTIIYEVSDNTTASNTYSAEVGKYFPKFKTNASLNYKNTESESFQKRNNIGFENNTVSQSAGVKFNNTYFSWMSIDYNATYSWNKRNNIAGPYITTNGYNHNLNLFVYPIENHTLGFYWDQVNTSNATSTYKNPFFDVSYQFTWAKKKIDFEVKWMNIANRKLFETYTVDGFTDTYSRIQLRPSQVMFTVKFNFK